MAVVPAQVVLAVMNNENVDYNYYYYDDDDLNNEKMVDVEMMMDEMIMYYIAQLVDGSMVVLV